MAQTVSDEELQAKRKKAEQIREQIAAEEAKASERRQEQERVIEAAQLDGELARLELQLHEAKERAKASAVNEATAPLVASAKEQMRMATEQLAAAKGDGGPGADTSNIPSDPEVAAATVPADVLADNEKATAKTEKDRGNS